MLDLAVFVPRLKQVIAWTDRLAQGFDFEDWNYGDVFRQFNPVINGQPLLTIDRGYAIWNADDRDIAVFKQALKAAYKERDAYEAVETSGNFVIDNFTERGRILCYELEITTNVGDAVVESSCFIDENDAPPTDTWFFLGEGFPAKETTMLFCWIPKQFEPKMQAAFEACDNQIFGMYWWLDELTKAFHPQVVAAMLKPKG